MLRALRRLTFHICRYDVKRTQEEIEQLTAYLARVESAIRPRKKFTFSSKNKADLASSANATMLSSGVIHETAPSSSSQVSIASSQATNNSKIIEGIIGGSVFLLDAKSLRITDSNAPPQILIRGCESMCLVVPTLIGSVRVEHLKECVLILGPCCTSVYLEGCSNTVVFTACHQLRIHTCTACELYVAAKTHPIIEDCFNMGFAPYSAVYPSYMSDLEVIALVVCA